MVILHITNSLGVGGAEWILYRLAYWQVEQGHDVVVINLGSERGFRTNLERAQVRVIQLTKPVSGRRALRRSGIALLKKWPSLFFAIRKVDPAIVHTWMYVADLYGGIPARLLGKPVIWGIFTGRVDKSMYSSVTWFLLNLCARMSRRIPDAVISCSAFGRRSHISLGYEKSRVLFIPTGFLRVPKAGEAMRDLGSKIRFKRDTPRLVLGMLGRVSREKRHDLLLAALSEVVDKGHEVHLFLAGGVGLNPSDSPLRRLIIKRNLQSHVTLLGCVDNLDDFFSEIDCFTLVSDSEGFPTVIGQAMSKGLPCIASDVGDTRLLLSDPSQIVEVNEAEVLAQAIVDHALMDVKSREALGNRNRDRLEKIFPEGLMFNRYNRVYKAVIKSSVKA